MTAPAGAPPRTRVRLRQRLQATLRKPAVFVPLIALVVLGWVAGAARGYRGWSLDLNGHRAGVTVGGGSLSLLIGVRWGWPSRAWLEREPLRAPGNPFGSSFHEGAAPFGFGLLLGGTTWFGNYPITVYRAGVALPWWYLLLLVTATPAQMLVLRLWPGREAERRRREGLCVRCGYDLRGTPDRCPECGLVADAGT